MSRLLLSAAALALVTGVAHAADFPPPPAPVSTAPMWAGFSVGVNAGGSWSNGGATDVVTWPTNALAGYWTTASLLTGGHPVGSAAGFIGGGQVGYNWRTDLQGYGIVAGLEADIQGIAGGKNAGQSPMSAMVRPFSNHSNFETYSATRSTSALSYLGTARGRLGLLVAPKLLVYGTGGLAYGEASLSLSQFQQFGVAVGSAYSSTAKTLAGWTAGAGVAWMFMPGWSVKAEYLYYDLGKLTTSNTFVAFGTAGPQWTYDAYANQRFNGNIVRAGVDYHFNLDTAAPVVATD